MFGGDHEMQKSPVRGVALALGAFVGLAAVAAASWPALADNIGSTTVVIRTVTGTLETQVKQLVIHDNVAQNELIATAPDAASEIEFIDGTKLRLGPRARVVLDKFVYDPDPSKGKFYLSVSEGVFRFATGHMDHQSYSISTPNGTLGVRGTEFNLVVLADRTVVQVTDGEVFGTADDGVPKSFRRGAYFTLFHSTDPSDDDDQSALNGQVALMDSLIGGTKFASNPPPGAPETHPFQQSFPTSPTTP